MTMFWWPYGEFMPGWGMTPPVGIGRRTGGPRAPGDGAGAMGCGCESAVDAWGIMAEVAGYGWLWLW